MRPVVNEGNCERQTTLVRTRVPRASSALPRRRRRWARRGRRPLAETHLNAGRRLSACPRRSGGAGRARRGSPPRARPARHRRTRRRARARDARRRARAMPPPPFARAELQPRLFWPQRFGAALHTIGFPCSHSKTTNIAAQDFNDHHADADTLERETARQSINMVFFQTSASTDMKPLRVNGFAADYPVIRCAKQSVDTGSESFYVREHVRKRRLERQTKP